MCDGHDALAEVVHRESRPLSSRGWLICANAEGKVLVAAVAVVANLVAASPLFSLFLAAASMALVCATGNKPLAMAKRLVVPSYLALVAIATQVLLVGQTPLFQLGPLVAYSEGLIQGVALGSKIIAGTSIVLALSLSVEVTEILALAARLRVPLTLIEIAGLTYRYLFLIAEEAEQIRDAQSARLGHNNWRNSLQSYSVLIGMVMVRSFDRAERVHEAMLLRGFDGSVPITRESGGSILTGVLATIPIVILLLLVGGKV